MMNWRQRIEAACVRQRFSSDDRQRAAIWETCAVGEQRSKQVLYATDFHAKRGDFKRRPYDDKLTELGRDFLIAVKGNSPAYALRLLILIERRSRALHRRRLR